MAKKIEINEIKAVKIANKYADGGYDVTEEAVCKSLNVTKHYFRKAIDYVIVLGIVNAVTAKAIAKKADANYRRKLKELGYKPSDKIEVFYKNLFKRRKEYLSLCSELEYIEAYFRQVNELEESLEQAKFQELTLDDFISSEAERDGFFKTNINSEEIAEKLRSMKENYESYVSEYNKILKRIEEIKKSL